jgi:hypothetical protein
VRRVALASTSPWTKIAAARTTYSLSIAHWAVTWSPDSDFSTYEMSIMNQKKWTETLNWKII